MESLEFVVVLLCVLLGLGRGAAPRIIVEAYDASGVMLAELTVPYGELPSASSSSEDPAGA